MPGDGPRRRGLALAIALGAFLAVLPGGLERLPRDGNVNRVNRSLTNPTTIACAIALTEGWRNPASLTRRLHNPGALVFAGQLGAAADSSGYAHFEREADGWRALQNELISSAPLEDLAQLARRWDSENAEAWARLVSAIAGSAECR